MAKLIVNPTSPFKREVTLERSILSIGRDPSNDVVLPDAMVSRRHAVVEHKGNAYVLRDCNSSNGSVVNGDRVSERQLADGDLLAIGSARLLFRQEAVAEDPAGKVVQHPSAPRLECPTCHAAHRKGDLFCRQCGERLPLPAVPSDVECPKCGIRVALPARFCSSCGCVLEVKAPFVATELEGIPKPTDLAPGLVKTTTQERPTEEELAGDPYAAQQPQSSVAVPLEPLDGVPGSVPSGEVVVAAADVPLLADAASAGSSPARVRVADPRSASAPRNLSIAPRPAANVPERSRPPVAASRRVSAPFLARLLSGLVDAGILCALELALLGPMAWYWGGRELGTPADVSFGAVALSVIAIVLATVVGLGYHVYFWGVRGATPGQALLELEIEREEGRGPIGMGRAMLRLVGYALSAGAFGLGFLMIAFTGGGLHDRIARTRVVSRGGRS